MASSSLTEHDWAVRLFVYEHFVATTHPPTANEIATAFDIAADEAEATLQRLHDGHALFLEPGTTAIRMANPLSAIPTVFRTQIEDRWLYANCAWDTLGVPAMLGSDAKIEARDAYTHEPITYQIQDGALIGGENLWVHFAVPFSHWYDDLIHT